MSERSLDEFELDEHTKQQMLLVTAELDNLQMSYDTRLLAALFAGRAASLYSMLITSGHLSQEDAQLTWEHAGQIINNPPEREVKTMSLMDGQIFDPEKTN